MVLPLGVEGICGMRREEEEVALVPVKGRIHSWTPFLPGKGLDSHSQSQFCPGNT